MTLTETQAAKLIYRATYGPKKGMSEIDNLMQIGVNAWFDEQYHTSGTSLFELSQSLGEQRDLQYQDYLSFYGAYWHKVCNDEDQLRQRMAYALSQILVVSYHGGVWYDWLSHYFDVLSKHALGNYRDLLKEVTLHPAMGMYLSLQNSKKHDPVKNTFPDENYARELMQLFTIGLYELKVNGIPVLDENGELVPTYTHSDVQEMARVLTGWKRSGGRHDPMIAVEANHDTGEKVVLGTVFPPGQTAEQDLEQALDMVFNHPATPVQIATQLIKRMVTSNPRRRYIKAVANVFIDNGQGVRGDLFAVAKAILTNQDALNGYGAKDNFKTGTSVVNFGKVKEPVIVMANLFRALGLDSHQAFWGDFGTIDSLGQALLMAPSVFNFYTPTDAPPGIISEAELTAPEFTILNLTNMNKIHNKFDNFIWADQDNGGTGMRHTTWDSTDFRVHAQDSIALVQIINERLFGGLMSNRLQTYLRETHSVFTDNPNRTDKDIVRVMLYTAQNSPEFRCEV